MPTYDYRCENCGLEVEIVHSMSESVERHEHEHAASGAACDGPMERLISRVGMSRSAGDKPPSDDKLKSLGFTKYVRGSSGYEKAFGGANAPDFVQRE